MLEGGAGGLLSESHPEVSSFLSIIKPPVFLAMRLRFLNFANMLFQSLAKKKTQKTKNKTQYVISPYFSFETKFNLPPLYPLNHDVLSHIVIHFLFHSVTFELSQNGPIAQRHFRASLPWFIVSSSACGFSS